MTTASASRGAVGQRRRSACGSASIPGRRPVSLRSYWEAVKAQAAKQEVNRQVLQVAFSDMVTSESLLDQLGPALIEPSSIFLYVRPETTRPALLSGCCESIRMQF